MPIIESQAVIDGETISIFIEVDKVPTPKNEYYNDEERGPTEKVIQAVRDVFGDGLHLVHNCAVQAVKAIKGMGTAIQPDEFEIQVAVKLDADVGAVLAKFGAEAQMQVTMKWIHEERPKPPAAFRHRSPRLR